MNGAFTNPDPHVVAYAGAQLKKGMEIAKKLGALNYGKLQTSSQSWFIILMINSLMIKSNL